ncbi:isopentenyl phosphate kinase [Chloroflexus sp.]|uniref:isopentenyl phosphate kinase n=1 Tax=Chloroflexus sp. TaxID=1904827 RepID=UPI002612535B|nr:isopentenyl phosphate kinase [uncultured Chloroflexus sp.]
MYTFIKFGGSVITDKTGREAADMAVIEALAGAVAAARAANPALALVIGHGSGSFGHHYAARYGVHRGLPVDADHIGFALTAAAALRLNRIVVDALLAAGVPAVSLQPSASLSSSGGQIRRWETEPISEALRRRLTPVIHGDVAFDTDQGTAIISTEALLSFLALHSPLRPSRIVLVGESAVFTADPHRDPTAQPIPLITRANITQVLHGTGASRAADVTGGMRSKLALMWQLIEALPELEVRLIGPVPELVTAALLGQPLTSGTLIRQ